MPVGRRIGYKPRFSFRSGPRKSSLDIACDKSADDFKKAQRKVDQDLLTLYRDSQRAVGAREYLRKCRAELTQALQALQGNDDAQMFVDSAQEDLAEAEQDQRVYRHNNLSDELVTYNSQRLRDEQRTQQKSRKELKGTVKRIEYLHCKLLEDMDNNFGTGLARKAKEINVDIKLEVFSEDARHVLKKRSIRDFTKAIYIWQKAYEAQVDICRVYGVKKISRLRAEVVNLADDVLAECSRDHPSTYNIDVATNRMQLIRREVDSLKLTREASKKLHRAEDSLQRAFAEMAHLRRKVESSVHDERPKTDSIELDDILSKPRPRRFGITTLISSNRNTRRAESRESSDTCGTGPRHTRSSYPAF